MTRPDDHHTTTTARSDRAATTATGAAAADAPSLTRRACLRGVLAGVAGATLGGFGPRARAASGDPWQQAFRAALPDAPWLLGFQGADREHYAGRAEVEGDWPAALAGTLYRNGPARHEIGDFRYRHWFDGDGMVHAWTIADGTVTHRARMVATHKYREESAAGRALYAGFDSIPGNMRAPTSPDSVNVANISVLPHAGRLLALWEAGSAWSLDPRTLATEGVRTWSPETRGLPFSAHPRIEPDGTLWNFGYSSAARALVFWHISPQGALQRTGVVKVDPISMPHDFIVTARHLVVLIPPFHFEPDGDARQSFLAAHRWHPERPTRVLVVDKDDFSRHFSLDLPPQWVFHFGNGWEDEHGMIRFDGARTTTPDVMLTTFRDVMRGISPPADRAADTAQHVQWTLDTRNRTIRETRLLDDGVDSEFPQVDPRRSTRRARWITVLANPGGPRPPHPMLTAVGRIDLESGGLRHWRYPDHEIPEEHLFVPEPGHDDEQRGWLLGTALDWRARVTRLSVFRAAAPQDGPVARATLPYPLPLGLHGRFVAA